MQEMQEKGGGWPGGRGGCLVKPASREGSRERQAPSARLSLCVSIATLLPNSSGYNRVRRSQAPEAVEGKESGQAVRDQ